VLPELRRFPAEGEREENDHSELVRALHLLVPMLVNYISIVRFGSQLLKMTSC